MSSSEQQLKSMKVKTCVDEATDTVYDICPFCNEYVKDSDYVGDGLYRKTIGGGHSDIDNHIIAVHGMGRMWIGRKYIWKGASSDIQTEVKEGMRKGD